MKISKTLIWAFIPLLVSCSQVELESIQPSQVSSEHISQAYRGTEEPVVNENNPYDIAGLINAELYDTYDQRYVVNHTLDSIISRLVTLGHSDTRFAALSATTYQFNHWTLLEEIIISNDSVLQGAINGAISDSNLRFSFHNFIIDIAGDCVAEANDASIYNKILAYESDILDDVDISINDQEVVLTTTSILRQCVCRTRKRAKKNTDRDWDLMITTMGASVEGSMRSKQDAIILALITELSLSQ